MSLLAALVAGVTLALTMFLVSHNIETLVNIVIGSTIGSCLGVFYLSGKLPLMKRTQDFPDLSLLLLGYVFIVLGTVISVESLVLGITTVKIFLLSSSLTIMGASALLYVKSRTKKTGSSAKHVQ